MDVVGPPAGRFVSADGPEQTAVDHVLATLRPKLRSGQFVFATLASAGFGMLASAEAMVAEDEGMTVVLAKDIADGAAMSYDYVAAWITLKGSSTLDTVGITASVTHALAVADIACNVLAGRNHDHLLVPWELRESAVQVIMTLAEEADLRLLSVA